jgi:hypothetical protein
MKLSDSEIVELNKLIRKGFNLPITKYEVTRYNTTYDWLRKNILVKNSKRITPRIAELLNIQLPETVE